MTARLIKKLRDDVEMYRGAVADLQEHGGEADVIRDLITKEGNAKQALNMLSGSCVSGGEKRRVLFVR